VKAGSHRLLQQRQQHLRQQKVPQVIRAQLHVKAVLRLPAGTAHDAAVVHEQVDLLLLSQEPPRALAHRAERRQVALFHVDNVAGLGGDLVGGIIALFHIAAEGDDPRAPGAQVLCRLLADASVGA
jgi:hypothetical protein